MRKLVIGAVLAISCLGAGNATHAQVRVNVNFGTPVTNATWYNTDESYYYLPEQGLYYNPSRKVYVYQDNGNWVYSSRLPSQYRGYSWQRSHYVRVRERAPFMHHDEYANRFNRNYRGSHVEWRRDDDRRGDDRHDDNRRGDDRDRNHGHH